MAILLKSCSLTASKMVFVKYFIPEDGDDQSHPNVFKVQGCASVSALTLGLLKKSFPVEGTYHFRFLTTVPGAKTKVWLDVLDDAAVLPQSEGSEVFAKISRIGVQQFHAVQQAPSSSSVPSRPVRQGPGSSATSASDGHATRRDSFGNPGSTNERSVSSDSNSGGASRRNSERLISFTEESPSKADFTRAPSGGEEGLLDFGASDDNDFNVAAAASSLGGSHSDLFSLDSATISPVPLSPSPMGANGGNPMGGMHSFGHNGSGTGLNGMGSHHQTMNPMGGGMGGQGQNMMGMGQGMGMQGINAMPHPSQLNAMNQQHKQNSFGGIDMGLRTMGNNNQNSQGRPYR